MTRNKYMIAGSVMALAMSAMLGTKPARAQQACEVNGTSTVSGNATGLNSLACGEGAIASDGLATSIGANSEASGVLATALGTHAHAFANNSTAVGAAAFVYGEGATAMGASSVALDENAAAVGYMASASGARSTAIGEMTDASADGATAVGTSAQATSTNGVAIGSSATTGAFSDSVALGANSTATAANQVNVGGRTVAGVASGSVAATSTEAVNGAQLYATNQNISALQTNLAAEATARMAADNALDTRIDALEAIALNFDDQLDRIDDRASAGTAVAVALSGATFLPDKTFNLTGNVGTYRGAVAGAIQAGAIVSPNVAVNVGIAKGFNKRGKTAARAGFTIGF